MAAMPVAWGAPAQDLDDDALPVQSVPTDEIEENLSVQPGNLSSLVDELPSMRLQASAPALGGIGLQLLGTAPDAFGLLQTPPVDVQRVEVIQGTASPLYGDAALAGVLNLVSRTPNAASTVLANVTAHDGQDSVGFFAHKDASAWSTTVTAGAHPGRGAFADTLHTQRWQIGMFDRTPIYDPSRPNLRRATYRLRSNHGTRQADNWVLGVAFAHETLAVPTVAGVSTTDNVPAVFAQDN